MLEEAAEDIPPMNSLPLLLLLCVSSALCLPLGHARLPERLNKNTKLSYGHAGSKSDYGSDAAHHVGSFYNGEHAGHDVGAAGYYSGHKDAEHSAAAKASSGAAHESEAHGGGAGSKYNAANSDFGKGEPTLNRSNFYSLTVLLAKRQRCAVFSALRSRLKV